MFLPNLSFKNVFNSYLFPSQDTHDPDSITKEIQGVPFKARFIQDIPEFSSLSNLQGVDGFVFSIDPLYEVRYIYIVIDFEFILCTHLISSLSKVHFNVVLPMRKSHMNN